MLSHDRKLEKFECHATDLRSMYSVSKAILFWSIETTYRNNRRCCEFCCFPPTKQRLTWRHGSKWIEMKGLKSEVNYPPGNDHISHLFPALLSRWLNPFPFWWDMYPFPGGYQVIYIKLSPFLLFDCLRWKRPPICFNPPNHHRPNDGCDSAGLDGIIIWTREKDILCWVPFHHLHILVNVMGFVFHIASRCACVETCFCQYRVIIEFATEPTRLTYDESVNHELVQLLKVWATSWSLWRK